MMLWPMGRVSTAGASTFAACLLVGSAMSATSQPAGQEGVAATASAPVAASHTASDAGVAKTRGHPHADGGSAPVEDRPCHSDADCTLTRVAAGECCPTLCVGRPVTRRRAQQLEANALRCAQGHGGCPQPLCRPPESITVPACEHGRCVTKEAASLH